MPTSHHEQLNEILDAIILIDPASVLDVGAGLGKFGILAREYLEASKGHIVKQDWCRRIDGIEGFQPYLSPLHEYAYDRLFVGDARRVLPELTERYDLALLIDVLEHFERQDGVALLHELRQHAENVLVSTPKRFTPQGVVMGNELEVHRSHWTRRDFGPFGDVCFIANTASLICVLGPAAARVRRGLSPWRRYVRRRLPALARGYQTLHVLASRAVNRARWRRAPAACPHDLDWRSMPRRERPHPGSEGTTAASASLARPMNRIGVLAVCPSAWRGVRQSITFDADAFSDPRGARTAIRLLRPSVVRFGGYDPAWRSILRRARAHGCAVVVTIQGTPAFHEFAASARTALAAAIEDHRRGLIDRLESPDPGVAGTLTALGIPCALNPNRLDPLPAPLVPTLSRSGLHLGILGSGHPCKNMDCQILAAALVLGEHGEGAIHVQHTAGGVLMRTVGVNYHVHPWMERSRFTGLLASMTLNLAVTFTEAFGYLPVESFLLGVPCLFTPMTTAFHEVEPSSPLWRCRVDRIDDPTAIARAIRDVLADRDAIAAAGRAFCQRHLRGARLG